MDNRFVPGTLQDSMLLMKYLHVACIFAILGIYTPIHEMGHVLMAISEDIPILGVGFSSVTVNELSFNTLNQIILFRASGFLFTFYPALLLFLYLWRKRSSWSHPVYLWLIVTPTVSARDFLDIGRLFDTSWINLIPYVLVQLSTTVMLAVYLYELYRRERLLFSFLIEQNRPSDSRNEYDTY